MTVDRVAELEAELAEIEKLMIGFRNARNRAEDKVAALNALLQQANEAFDECTSNYAKELVADEPWRKVGQS